MNVMTKIRKEWTGELHGEESVKSLLKVAQAIVVCFAMYGCYQLYATKPAGNVCVEIPPARAKVTWEKAHVVDTFHQPSQPLDNGLYASGSVAVQHSGSLEENKIYYTLPMTAEGDTIFTADVDHEFLLRAERDGEFYVRIRSDRESDRFIVDESTVRPMP